jgi:hypothetical protein
MAVRSKSARAAQAQERAGGARGSVGAAEQRDRRVSPRLPVAGMNGDIRILNWLAKLSAPEAPPIRIRTHCARAV